MLGQGAREPLAARAHEHPGAHAGEHEDRRPAQQADLAVDQERDQPVGALEVAAGEARVGRALALDVGRVRRRPVVERLVQGDVEDEAEERELGGEQRERAAPRPQQRPCREHADHDPRGHEFRPQPRERAHQQEAARRGAARDPLLEPQREQGSARQRGGGGQLGVDRASVREEWRRQRHGQRRADRPRVGHDAQREQVREHPAQRRDRGQEQLHRLRAAQRECRRDQGREARAVRLVRAPVDQLPVPVEELRVELLPVTRGALVADVEVAVVHERLRRQ